MEITIFIGRQKINDSGIKQTIKYRANTKIYNRQCYRILQAPCG